MFRPEALAAAQTRGQGTILLAQPLSQRVLAGLFTIVAAAVVLFICFFSVTRQARVAGTLVPSKGLMRIASSQGGTVTKRLVSEGQAVHAGDPMFVVSSDHATRSLGNASQTISSLLEARRQSLDDDRTRQRVQESQRIDAARRKADELRSELQRIEEQIHLQEKRAALAEQSLKRYRDLATSGFVSSAQADDRQAELLDQRQHLADLVRARAAARRDMMAAESEARDLSAQMQRDDEAAARGIAAIEQDIAENEARRELAILAPQEGVVTTITAEPGQAVAPGQGLASILPADSTLEAELLVPSRSIGFIATGQPVWLRYQAYPHQKFGQYRGHVREIAKASLRPEDLGASTGGSAGEPFYRVRVRLEHQAIKAYGKDQPLPVGMALEASVVLERRRLVEWVLDPLYAVAGRI
jgi:membrane fusion protein